MKKGSHINSIGHTRRVTTGMRTKKTAKSVEKMCNFGNAGNTKGTSLPGAGKVAK